MIIISVIMIVKKTSGCGCVSIPPPPLLETVSISYGINIYTQMYVAVLILDYSQREPMGQGLVTQMFDGKFMSADIQIPIICLYTDLEGLNLLDILVSSSFEVFSLYGIEESW
jgi:hypothetical protein